MAVIDFQREKNIRKASNQESSHHARSSNQGEQEEKGQVVCLIPVICVCGAILCRRLIWPDGHLSDRSSDAIFLYAENDNEGYTDKIVVKCRVCKSIMEVPISEEESGA